MIIPGKYIWNSKDVDYPVTVVSSLGFFDGREYAKIEESTTAIPIDELKKIPDLPQDKSAFHIDTSIFDKIEAMRRLNSRRPPNRRLF